MMSAMRLLLASASPRRAELLRAAGFSFDTLVVDVDETPQPGEAPSTYVRRLSGRSHQVLTGLSLRCNGNEAGRVETTDVEFMQLSEADVAWYVARGEGRDKAGAYAIQGLGSRFIVRIDGSYSNVVGLPIHTVFVLLREMV